MSTDGGSARDGLRELLLVLLASVAATIAVTYPWALRIGHAARLDSLDGQFSIWNVAWVARTLVTDPRHVFDANIFYPHRGTLFYSETNLGAGMLAIPAYWTSRNPYLAHDSVVMAGFVLSATGFYYLARYLVRDRRAAAVSATCFAFCPFVFARTTEVQLLMTFGIPVTMLAFHRLIDRPTAARAVVLGVAIALQTIFCAYYGVFVALIVSLSVLIVTATRNRWRDSRHWRHVAVAGAVALLLILPLFVPYLLLQRDTGAAARSLREAARFSSDWRSYLASPAGAHRWLLYLVNRWNDVDFPGFVATSLGMVGVVAAWRAGGRTRELAILYGTIVIVAFWASFGPAAGLYSALYHTIPAFTMMRAPSRFALVVVFGLSVLAALGVRAWISRISRPTVTGILLAIVAAAELSVQLRFSVVPPVNPLYRVLSQQPRGVVIEMPFFRVGRVIQHTRYMLNSTNHWMPLVNGFSDWIPEDFASRAATLEQFPSAASFKVLHRDVRYAVVHLDLYGIEDRIEVEKRLAAFSDYLRPLYVAESSRLYEIVGWPPD